jgi:formylglycine-generating enzyme required for sulfatase activity
MSQTRWKITLTVFMMLLLIAGCEEEDTTDDMIFIKGGNFTMGDAWGDGWSHELPTHEVTVSSFYMGKYEVTQAEVEAILGDHVWSDTYGKGDDYPAYSVSWYEAVEYCNVLSSMEGLDPCYTISETSVSCDFTKNGYRLPTEAEWEYAAGGGSSNRTKYAGTNSEISLGNYAWYGLNSGNKPHPVGEKQPNALGLYDMSGNVWEWCWDWYGSYSSTSQTNPTGPSSGSYRVLRGGSWYDGATYCRVVVRYGSGPSGIGSCNGFRLLRNAE